MSAPLSRSSGRCPPVSPARTAPLVASRSPGAASHARSSPGYYHADPWSSLSSPSSTPLSASPLHTAPRGQRGVHVTGYTHGRAVVDRSEYVQAAELRSHYDSGLYDPAGPQLSSQPSSSGSWSSSSRPQGAAIVTAGSPVGSLTAVLVPAAPGSQAAEPRLGLGGATLTSPRCESPSKGPYGVANYATHQTLSEASTQSPASTAASRPRFTSASRCCPDTESLLPLPTTYGSEERGGNEVVVQAAEVSTPLRRGLAARAAASLQPRTSNRRGSSMDPGPRVGASACERSLSAGIRCLGEGVAVRSATARPCTSTSSLSALPTLNSAEAMLREGGRDLAAADGGSSTVPAPSMHGQQYLSGSRGARGATVANGANSATKGVAGNVQPEAEPAARLSTLASLEHSGDDPGAYSVETAGVLEDGPISLELQDERGAEDLKNPMHTLNSANVEVNDEGNLNMHVRIMPSELIRWKELHIVQPISTGSFGEVFLARYKDTEVSVKRCILGQGGSMTKEQLHNLEREINTYRTLNHPSIVKYIGCVLEHPNLAVVTEYVPNGNVFDLLFTHRVNLPAAIRLKIAGQVALALNYMHSCDPIVIHRDLKTQNLVLDVEYSVKLCDFGKTQPMEDDSALPLQSDNGGSPRYMAPECFQLGAYITEKVDIWSLGCCLVEVLGGPLPYEDVPQMSQVVTLILRHRQTPLVPPWFAPEIRPMLAGCFDFDPEMRIPISEVQMALRRLTPEQLERHGMDKRRTR